ncbi:hypothetical protein H8D29_03510 [PVC group bacterium]|nr:hypothetical protein [PVC group bacterium]
MPDKDTIEKLKKLFESACSCDKKDVTDIQEDCEQKTFNQLMRQLMQSRNKNA